MVISQGVASETLITILIHRIYLKNNFLTIKVK